MKPNSFKYSVLAVGVVAAMGITTANAATTSGATSSGAAPINNVATASYSVGTVAQPTVTSNTVTVNVSETANFSLVAINGASATDDKNEDITTTPGNGATFNHTLTNEGNVSDTYTINTTGNNDTTITTATPNYALGTAGTNGITYTIVKADGTAAVASDLSSGQAVSGTLSNGGTIKLPPGFKANLSYTVTTPNTHLGGDISVGTLTATSTFITAATASGKVPTLVNENQNIVRLPTFKIAKTATSNVDLSVTNPQIDYIITVTNLNTAYSAIADNFVIRDVLPLGMTLSGNVTASSATVTSTNKDAEGRQIIDIAVPSLAVGANQVVTFKVNVAKASYTAAGSTATNNVAVYDKFVGNVGALPVTPVADTNYDILDSTVTTNDRTRVPTSADVAGGVGEDTPGVTSFSNRAIVLNNPTTREIAPTSDTAGQVTHTTNIINNGQDAEGTNTNPLTFTIADGGLNTAVAPTTPVTITYTAPGGVSGTPITLTPVSGVYTINSTTLPSGIAPGGTVAINYKVTSTAAAVGSNETTIVTLTPGGNGAPTVAPVTDTTNVKGLNLEKFQALDATCTGTVAAASFSKDAISGAAPDQCIIYRINATNTSSAIQTTTPAAASGFNITSLTVSDLLSNFSAGADLVTGSPASSVTGTGSSITAASTSTTAVSTTASTLVPQGVATLTFKVKIKNAR
ncbi:hypothetical protein IP510_01535 [Psychrobacter sp. NG254]|uniref:beta strand repeat-containing protein n=1 Tax=Psychrobacter sp. NG254 TaxID=2782003 RepID=UPI00188908B9|nr:hypothetical protein [Psychrobacter sp. NG254]MBF2718561.1 hypothetical protein [Psychrobacter sp. NG254]